MSRFDEAIARIDALHAEDPTRVQQGGGEIPKELLYARRMSEWLERLRPEASEALRLAVRSQHLQRWSLPRDQYPKGRAGYRRWRSELARRHAARAAEILEEVGYDAETIARVGALIRKQRLASDPEAQALEDAACLVFLELDFTAFAAKHDDGKLVDIVQKTWKKMSERGRKQALALELPDRARALVERAVAG